MLGGVVTCLEGLNLSSYVMLIDQEYAAHNLLCQRPLLLWRSCNAGSTCIRLNANAGYAPAARLIGACAAPAPVANAGDDCASLVRFAHLVSLVRLSGTGTAAAR